LPAASVAFGDGPQSSATVAFVEPVDSVGSRPSVASRRLLAAVKNNWRSPPSFVSVAGAL
jgi:hypothetical protein